MLEDLGCLRRGCCWENVGQYESYGENCIPSLTKCCVSDQIKEGKMDGTFYTRRRSKKLIRKFDQ